MEFNNLEKLRRNTQKVEKNRHVTKNNRPSQTCQIIHEQHRWKKLEGRIRIILNFLLSLLLATGSIIIIGVLQYDEYFAFINQRQDYINATKSFCNVTAFDKIDIISTPISCVLILLYIILYKRRVFLRHKYKYRNIGLP